MKIEKWIACIAVVTAMSSPAFGYENNWMEETSMSYAGQVDASCGCPSAESLCCNDDCCGCSGGLFNCCLGEPWTLKDQLLCPDSPYNIGGWSAIGYTSNNVPLSNAYNDLLSFGDVPDHLHLNQQWLYFEKVASTDDCCGDWGFRIDAMYGTDAQKTQAFGNPRAGNRNQGTFDASLDHGEYGWAIPQAYVQYARGDLDIKVGHFFTLIGYEVVPATGNFFYSHAYTMFNSEPFTHTGAIATYTGFQDLTLYGGWTLGWDTGFDQLNGGNNFLGGFSKTICEDLTFTYMTTYGNFGWRDGGGSDSYNHSIVVAAKLTDKFEYVIQSDMVDTNNGTVSQYDTIGINQYLFYTYNDCTKLGTRLEWWKADGVSYNAITFGLNYKAHANLTFRPEFRHDWSPAIGLERDTFGVDAILTF